VELVEMAEALGTPAVAVAVVPFLLRSLPLTLMWSIPSTQGHPALKLVLKVPMVEIRLLSLAVGAFFLKLMGVSVVEMAPALAVAAQAMVAQSAPFRLQLERPLRSQGSMAVRVHSSARLCRLALVAPAMVRAGL